MTFVYYTEVYGPRNKIHDGGARVMDTCNEGWRRSEAVEEAHPPTKITLQLWGRSLITERISRQKTLGWVESLEGTGSEWAAGAHVHQEDACGAAPVRRVEIEVARGPRGDREAVLTA